jgi:hypothetical protein
MSMAVYKLGSKASGEQASTSKALLTFYGFMATTLLRVCARSQTHKT